MPGNAQGRYSGYYRLNKKMPWQRLVSDAEYNTAWRKLLDITATFGRGETLVTARCPKCGSDSLPGQRRGGRT
jgi:hypothetical protein